MKINAQRLRYYQFGEPAQVLRLEEYPLAAEPSAQRCLVRLTFAPINPSDLIPIQGHYAHRIALPQVPGYEGVGTIVACGSKVSNAFTGRRTLLIGAQQSWQSHFHLDYHQLVPIPDGVDDVSAAQICINPLTAWLLLTHWLPLLPGDTLIINGGGSAFSLILVQLARRLALKSLVIIRSERHRGTLLAAGAERVLNHEELMTHQPALIRQKRINAAIDCVGGAEGIALAHCLNSGSHFVAIGLLGGQQVDWQIIQQQLRLRASLFHLRRWLAATERTEQRRILQMLFQLVQQGELQLEAPGEIYPLRQFALAIRRSTAAERPGKIFFSGD